MSITADTLNNDTGLAGGKTTNTANGIASTQSAAKAGTVEKELPAVREKDLPLSPFLISIGYFSGIALAFTCLAGSALYLFRFLSTSHLSTPTADRVQLVDHILSSRIELVSCGMFIGMSLAFLGFSLFLLGVRAGFDGKFDGQGSKFEFSQMAPGAFVILAATVLIGMCVKQTVSVTGGDDGSVLNAPSPQGEGAPLVKDNYSQKDKDRLDALTRDDNRTSATPPKTNGGAKERTPATSTDYDSSASPVYLVRTGYQTEGLGSAGNPLAAASITNATTQTSDPVAAEASRAKEAERLLDQHINSVEAKVTLLERNAGHPGSPPGGTGRVIDYSDLILKNHHDWKMYYIDPDQLMSPKNWEDVYPYTQNYTSPYSLPYYGQDTLPGGTK